MAEEGSKNNKIRLQKAIATLEEKRDELGSEIVDIALAPLREKLENISDNDGRKLRKYVTVLFADISDFTKICGSHDAEYVTEALNYLWTALDSIVIKHGGVIDKHIGEAGIGKSRLLHEFRKRVERESDDIVFFNARCTPEMQNTPCSVFRDILRYRMNVRETDSAEVAWKKFEAETAESLTLTEIASIILKAI